MESKKFVGIEPLIVGPGIKSGISVQLENPRNVGADRIADCAGAFSEYGGPILVADFGTATTYDYVDENGCFKAGAIGVGIETGANALWGQTAQLPEIEIKRPKLSWQEIHKQKCKLVYFINSWAELNIQLLNSKRSW